MSFLLIVSHDYLLFKWSVAVGNDINNNKQKYNGTPIDFHTIKVPKDDTMIDDEVGVLQFERNICQRQ